MGRKKKERLQRRRLARAQQENHALLRVGYIPGTRTDLID